MHSNDEKGGRVTSTTWRAHLAPYGELFDDAFFQRWGDQPWSPSDDDEEAAAELHIQVVSRITTQRLAYAEGLEASALDSVHQLFKFARETTTRHAECKHVETVVWHVLNTHVRPFTAKWHRLSATFAARDATDVFRAELVELQKCLSSFDDLLVDLRDGARPPAAPAAGASQRETKIAREMDTPLSWGIHRKLGGLKSAEAVKLNEVENAAISLRREHYELKPRPPQSAAAGAPAPAPPAAPAPAPPAETPQAAEPSPPPDPRQYAVALALSGGGIRSATFSLGVLIALARRNLLYQFDYLSTVSGGGYLGSFLTAFLNSSAPTRAPQIGLRRDELPFQREAGEAAALRHLRHHSKYLATGGAWERTTTAFAQVYGMVLNGLGLAYLALVLALIEWLIRDLLGIDGLWTGAIAIVAAILVLAAVLLPIIMRWRPSVQKHVDSILGWIVLILLVLLAWRALGAIHVAYGDSKMRIWVLATAAVPLIASAILALSARLVAPVRWLLLGLSAVAVPALFLGVEVAAYSTIEREPVAMLVLFVIGTVIFVFALDINFTGPHRHYRKKLAEAYLIQPERPDADQPFRSDVTFKVSEGVGKDRAPYHLVNCALNVPASKDSRMQGRLTDFFLFSPRFSGSPLIGYRETEQWEKADPHLDLGTAMAISGAAVAPQMGLGTQRYLSVLLSLLNVRLSYWLRNPMNDANLLGSPPGLYCLLREMLGLADEKGSFINLSDGGHIENLGVYELLRRRCKYIVAIDGEQDQGMTFHGLATLQRLAAIDLGVTIDINLDDLRLDDRKMSRSHFAFCRIRYPNDTRDGPVSYGYLLYLKLSLTGNEGEFLRRYRLDEPSFPHHSTADQFFTEAQFEAYRSLGEHVGDRMFTPALVGSALATATDVKVEAWFREIGKSMLDPLEDPPVAAAADAATPTPA